jgi:hypothetical protein
VHSLQYPKAAWIRLGDDFDVRSLVEAKGLEFRQDAETTTLGTTKGVFIPPVHKATALKTCVLLSCVLCVVRVLVVLVVRLSDGQSACGAEAWLVTSSSMQAAWFLFNISSCATRWLLRLRVANMADTSSTRSWPWWERSSGAVFPSGA